MKKIYVSNDLKPIRGEIRGIKGIKKMSDGFLMTFKDDDRAYRTAQVLINSGYETVKILEG